MKFSEFKKAQRQTKHQRYGSYKETIGDKKVDAEKRARLILEYWLSKGVKPKVWVEAVAVPAWKGRTETLYVVRSEGIPCR
jgi:hypothetical protein